jgi:inorganic pyrophosphatase
MSQHPEKVRIRVEVSRGGFVKRRPDGTVDFASPLPCPFSYGSVEGRMAPDGDPEDALIVGSSPQRGEVLTLDVYGRVLFIDAGVEDHKWICAECPPSSLDMRRVERFFSWYAWAKRLLYWVRGVKGGARFEGVENFSPQ